MRSYNRHPTVILLAIGMTLLLAIAADWLMAAIKLTHATRADPSIVFALPATLINILLCTCVLWIARALGGAAITRSIIVMLVGIGAIGTVSPLLDLSMVRFPPFYTFQLLTFPTTYTGRTCACLLVLGLYALRLWRKDGTPHD